MARQRERTSAKETAYAEKHRILQALEELATPKRWPEFKKARRAYRKFRKKRRNGRGDRYDRKKLLQDCEDTGLIDQDEHALIKTSWDSHVDSILAGMDEALHSVSKGDELNCWIIFGGSPGEDRVVHQKRGATVDVVILTKKWPPPGPWKGMRGMDPGFLRRLTAHHGQVGGLIARAKKSPRRKKR
jgi:hypothetical protein